ncbi:MAG: HAMP domain-containing histidine kinase, partial [Ruminococcus sp.]|nr:HAMP domain-containing histidine kinase [Ruminococcus sp.]
TEHNNDIIRILKKYSKGDFSEKINDNMPFTDETAKYINKLASDVETSEETGKTFIANVSHELRTPITTIGGFVDGILDGTIPKNRRNEYLVLVSNEIQRLKVLISSMLNMSRFESGTLKPNFQKTNLTDLVIKTAFMFEKKIESKNVEVEEFDAEDLTAEVDPDLMQQVIYNLMENAVKFVNTGGKISFRFEKEGDMCIIGIRNTGEGLKDNEIQQVFDRFYKTDSSRGKDTTGLGLGLSISRRIVHINNGQIVVKSIYGEYTEFQVQLPEKQKKS